jgi:2-polyprenyl-6-methoxyphenol hydroxylase-like FAD-dependent oxidoreductase
MKIAISGCGVAGPALAWWLLHYGHEPLLIEEAPRLRDGGYIIDFWGIGYDIAERMGLVPQLREAGYQVEEVRFVDERGHRNGGFPVSIFNRLTHDRFTSLRRSDVSGAIFRALNGRAEALFGESIRAVDDRGGHVHLEFEKGLPRDVDLLIGADGLHSRVRSCVFGPEERYERFLGYYVAAFETSGYRPRNELIYMTYSEPGRQVSRFSMRDDRTMFLFVFADAVPGGRFPTTDAERRTALRSLFGESGWECAQILDAMDGADGIYFDRVSQIRMDAWAKGRTALVGDAGACVSLLAGEGTGLAIAEAYVLAGELHRAEGDHALAFDRYQKRLQPFLLAKQESARKFATSFAPKTAFGIRVRNLATGIMRLPGLGGLFLGGSVRDDIDLPNDEGSR